MLDPSDRIKALYRPFNPRQENLTYLKNLPVVLPQEQKSQDVHSTENE